MMKATTVMADEDRCLRLVEEARSPSDLFSDRDSARAVYRRLARRVHPDLFPPGERVRAERAFSKLTQLWDEHTNPRPAQVLATRSHRHALEGLIARGSISNVYASTTDDDALTVAKVVRSPRHNSLAAREVQALGQLTSEVPVRMLPFYPALVDNFRQRDARTRKDRQVVVLERLEGSYSLRQVMDRYPQGLDPRDLAWMARRLWTAVAGAHAVGVLHCAIVPENVHIFPEEHGLVLLDWAFSRAPGGRLRTALPEYLAEGWYGDAALKQSLDHRLDARMASHALEALLGPRRAAPFRAFFKGCRLASTPRVGQLSQEFDELLERLYGRRRFRPFTVDPREGAGDG